MAAVHGMLSGSRYYVVGRFGTFLGKTRISQAATVGRLRQPLFARARLYHLLIHLKYYSSITIGLGCGSTGAQNALSHRQSLTCCSARGTLPLGTGLLSEQPTTRDAAAARKTMADDATRTSTTSLEDDDDQRYLDDAAWARREEGYRQQIRALEEQHKTLKNAWSDIVRTNLLKVDELKKELEAKRAKRDSVRDALAAARSTGAATHDRLVAELCSAKVEVAELNERRDRARKKLGEEARTLVGL